MNLLLLIPCMSGAFIAGIAFTRWIFLRDFGSPEKRRQLAFMLLEMSPTK